MMYQLVRNPYAVPQPSSPARCCLFFCVGLVTIAALAGLFAFSSMRPPFLMPDALTDAEISSAFTDFIATYGRAYGTVEEAEFRYKIFESNYRLIHKHNSNPYKTCTLGVNQFADLTDSEFQRYYLSKPISQHAPASKTIPPPNPDLNVDWVEKGKVNKVKDQGMCGSCWTFSAVSVVETLVSIKENRPPERYSEQQLVDCCRTELSQGCNGGEEEDAFNYMTKTGIALESLYPYKAVDDVCKDDKVPIKLKIAGYVDIENGDNAGMEEMIQNLTLSVGVAASHYVFRFYKSGIITEGCPGDIISHAVTVVGAGTKDNIPYWVVRNSWGPNWGDKGYLKIARVADGSNGVCGITCCAQYIKLNE